MIDVKILDSKLDLTHVGRFFRVFGVHKQNSFRMPKNTKKRLTCFKSNFGSKILTSIIDGAQNTSFFFLQNVKKSKTRLKNANPGSTKLVFLT